MNTQLLTLVFIIFGLSCNDQNIAKDSILKVGFYKNIQELIDNIPSSPFNYEINSREIYVAKSAFKSEKTKIYNLTIEKDSTNIIGDIIGFSNGKNVYLKTANTGTFANYKSNNFSTKSNFIKIEELDIYTYFINIGNMNYGGGGLAGSLSVGINNAEYIINLKTAETQPLTTKLIKKLLSDEPDLLQEFEADKNRKKNFEKYITEYNRRYKARL